MTLKHDWEGIRVLHGKKIVAVLPAYEAEQILEQTLANISFDVDEVLFVDDAGTDAAVALAREGASV
jgi:glycosyltransferase involved in cell wall biosynthesis